MRLPYGGAGAEVAVVGPDGAVDEAGAVGKVVVRRAASPSQST